MKIPALLALAAVAVVLGACANNRPNTYTPVPQAPYTPPEGYIPPPDMTLIRAERICTRANPAKTEPEFSACVEGILGREIDRTAP